MEEIEALQAIMLDEVTVLHGDRSVVQTGFVLDFCKIFKQLGHTSITVDMMCICF